jgi:hypothetical protein
MSAMLGLLTGIHGEALRMESNEKPAPPQRRKKVGSGIALGTVFGVAIGAALDKAGVRSLN